MKLFPFVLALFIAITANNTQANEPSAFTIPRSTVHEVTDTVSGRVYPLFIKLPRSYDSQTDKRYPVIYLTDAMYSFQIVSGATRFPMNTGKMQEAIIVGIAYEKGSQGPTSRIRDYTHVKDATWQYQTGEAKQHITFIEQTVFPFVEKNYRTSNSRTFVGNSLGGLLGAYILLSNPRMFNNYVLGSPSVWFKHNHLLSYKSALNINHHKVFIGVGEEESPLHNNTKHDMVAGAEALKQKITSELFPNTQVKLVVINGANHETAFPTTAVQGLYWLFKHGDK